MAASRWKTTADHQIAGHCRFSWRTAVSIAVRPHCWRRCPLTTHHITVESRMPSLIRGWQPPPRPTLRIQDERKPADGPAP